MLPPGYRHHESLCCSRVHNRQSNGNRSGGQERRGTRGLLRIIPSDRTLTNKRKTEKGKEGGGRIKQRSLKANMKRCQLRFVC